MGLLELRHEDNHKKATKALRRRREDRGLTQVDVARLVASSQPRVAHMEAGETSVSIDRLVRTLLALGSSLNDLARAA